MEDAAGVVGRFQPGDSWAIGTAVGKDLADGDRWDGGLPAQTTMKAVVADSGREDRAGRLPC